MFRGYTYQPNHETDKILEDEDSEDDVIFEPMQSAAGVEARSPGGLSMVRFSFSLLQVNAGTDAILVAERIGFEWPCTGSGPGSSQQGQLDYLVDSGI
jgi:hypothetical protein